MQPTKSFSTSQPSRHAKLPVTSIPQNQPHFPSPAWKSRAVRHAGVRTERQISKRPANTSPTYFINPKYPFTGAPKNRGRRLPLDQIP